MSGTERPARIELMDALRGLAVCLMVLHHFLYDLCEFLGAPWWLFTNPVFDVLHYFFAGLFIFLSGISSDFSRSNLKRGAKAMALALGITLVTYFMDMTIVFGVLHLLASCMLLFGLTRKLWEALPAWVLPVLCLALIFLTVPCADGVTTQTPQLSVDDLLGGVAPAMPETADNTLGLFGVASEGAISSPLPLEEAYKPLYNEAIQVAKQLKLLLGSKDFPLNDLAYLSRLNDSLRTLQTEVGEGVIGEA